MSATAPESDPGDLPMVGHKGLARRAPSWFGPAVLLGCFLVVFVSLLWLLRGRSYETQRQELAASAEVVRESIRLRLDGNRDYLLLLAADRSEGRMDAGTFQERGSRYVADHPEMICINWVDAGYLITDVAPLAPNRHIVGLRLELPEPKRASRLARETRHPVYTHPFQVIQGELAFELWVPVFREDVFLGLLGGIYSYQKLLRTIVSPPMLSANSVSVVDGSGQVLLRVASTATVDASLVHLVPLNPPGDGVMLLFDGHGPGPIGWGFLALELLCLALVLGMAYAMWQLNRGLEARKRAERDLSLVSFALNNVREAAFLIDEDARIRFVNDESCRVLGYSREELLALRVADVDPGFPQDRWAGHWRELRAKGSLTFESRHKARDGRLVPVEISASFFEFDGLGYNLALARDITERKKGEELLRQREAALNESQRVAHIGGWDWDATKDTIWWSDEYYRIYGHDPARPTPDYAEHLKAYTPESAKRLDVAVKRAMQTGEPYEVDLELARPAAGTRWIAARGEAKRDATGAIWGLRGTAQDITERKLAEAALQERHSTLRSILDSAQALIFSVDRHYRYTSFNQGHAGTMRALYGAEIALGRVMMDYMTVPADRENARRNLDRALAGEQLVEEAYSGEDLRSRMYFRVSHSPIKTEAGEVIGVAVLAHDMTGRRRAEEEVRTLNQELEARVADRTAQLEAANKELEAFAYSVSHDLRAPLRQVGGFLELLGQHAGPALDEGARHYMKNANEAAARMGTLIEDLLSFSRMGRQEMSRTQVDLAALAGEVAAELEPETRGRVVRWRIGALPVVTGDRAMLRTVLVNLLSNALKFTRPRPEAEIELAGGTGPRGEQVISVRDNGVGFDMAYADRLFEVFHRLHRAEEFEGVGIGLANVRRVIARHGGRTWAEGTVDGGATFHFSLPG